MFFDLLVGQAMELAEEILKLLDTHDPEDFPGRKELTRSTNPRDRLLYAGACEMAFAKAVAAGRPVLALSCAIQALQGHRRRESRQCLEAAESWYRVAKTLIESLPEESISSRQREMLWYHAGWAFGDMRGDFRFAIRAHEECKKVAEQDGRRYHTALEEWYIAWMQLALVLGERDPWLNQFSLFEDASHNLLEILNDPEIALDEQERLHRRADVLYQRLMIIATASPLHDGTIIKRRLELKKDEVYDYLGLVEAHSHISATWQKDGVVAIQACLELDAGSWIGCADLKRYLENHVNVSPDVEAFMRFLILDFLIKMFGDESNEARAEMSRLLGFNDGLSGHLHRKLATWLYPELL